MQEGKRYLVERNGVQFAGTYDGASLISNIDGNAWPKFSLTVIRELTGLEAMKVGDVIVNIYGHEAKILAFTNNHTSFLRSYFGNFDKVAGWFTFKEAEAYGYELKGQPEKTELTLEEVADKFNIPVENLQLIFEEFRKLLK